MAVSGSVSTDKYDGRYYTLSWTATQDVNTNKTTVKWTLKAVGGNSSWYAERTLKMTATSDNTLSGTTSYSKTSRVERYAGTIKTGTFYVTHDSNGDAEFKISLQAAVYTSSVNCTGSKTFTLTNIPRKSTLSVADGVLNTSQTIKVTRKSSSFTHTIVATCGDQSKTICSKSSTLSFAFTPPIAWASENTTGKTVEVTYKITTYNGSTSIGSNSYTVDCDIPSSLVTPSLELAVTDTKGYFEKYGKYIQGQSVLKIVAAASGLYGATIKSYKTTVDGSTYTSATSTTSVLKGSGSLSLSCVITDSRGFTKTVSKTLTVLAYKAPVLTKLTSKRCDEDGTSNNSGDYLKVIFSSEVTSLENKNTVRVTVQYKKTAETNYASKEVTVYNDVYTITNGSYIFAADKSYTYDITLIIEDSFGYVDRYTTGASESVWRSRLWRGLGVAFGKFAELEGYLDSGWRIFARRGLRFPLVPEGTDLNEMIETGTYPAGKLSVYKYLNCPAIGDVSFALEVAEAGPDGELLQRLVTVEDEPKTFCRRYANKTWGNWIDKVSELNSNLLWYSPGDSVYIDFWCAGVMTNGNKDIYIGIPINRPIGQQVSSVKSSDLKVILRQDNNYLAGSTATDFISPDNYDLELRSNGLFCRFMFNNSIGGTNNDVIGILVRGNINFY